MGLIRGGLLIIFGILLFISILATAIFWNLTLSLENQNLKSNLADIVVGQIEQHYGGIQSIQDRLPVIQSYCQNNTDYVFQENGQVFVVSCDVAGQGQEAVAKNVVANFIDRSYYTEYSCGFWNCFKQGDIPFFLASKQAHDYWQSKLYFVLLTSLILLALVLLFAKDRTGVPFIVGAFMIVSGLIVLKVDVLFSLFGQTLYQFISVFFNQSFYVFLKFLFFGIGIIIIGIILKIFKTGFKFSNLMEKIRLRKNSMSKDEVKEIVKKEVAKSKDEKKRKK
ncbi:MAG: hypothetical protein AABW63_00285 [Nanoarchaeota archaeon]